MTAVLCIDPGYSKRGEGCACALAVGGTVQSVWYERSSTAVRLKLPALDAVVVEKPQQDKRSRGIPPEVLIELTWEGCAVGARYAGMHDCRLLGATPSRWKGSTPKPVQHYHVWQALSESERAMLGGYDARIEIEKACERGALDRWSKPGVSYYPRGFTLHNLLDAVCMCIAQAGRRMKSGVWV